MAILPTTQPFSSRDTLSIADLADDPVIGQRGADPAWEAFHNVDPRPDGRHPRAGPIVDCIEEKFEHVAAGPAIGMLPASAAAVYARPGVVCRPVRDVPSIRVCVVWPSARSSDVSTDLAASIPQAESKPATA